jgi:hypothetical protein
MANVYETVNKLEEIGFIAGTPFTDTFECFDENGTPLVLGGSGIIVKISEYGNPSNVVISKTGSIISSNIGKVEYSASDTINLSGKFIQQPIIIASDSSQHTSQQGLWTIFPRNQ